MKLKHEKLIFIFYMLAFLLAASTLALYQPIADTPPLICNPPDEHARFLIPWYICDTGKIPTGFEEEIRIPAYGFSYGLYNVFPYIVQGFVMRFVRLFTDSYLYLLYAGRFVNVLSGAGMAYVVYLLSKKLFSDRRFSWLFCFAVMFLPENLFMHTYINTDSMCLLSTAMMVYALVSAYREGFTVKNNLWLCAGIILCALSYYNAYGYIVSSILLFLAYFLEKKDGKWQYHFKDMLKKGIFISVIVLLGISWWFIRSYILFDGDMLGLATREKMAMLYASESVNPLYTNTYQKMGYSVWQMLKETHFAECVISTFIAAYGSVSILGNVWIYRFFKAFIFGGLLCCILINKPSQETSEGAKINLSKCKKNFPRWKNLFFHLNMIFCILMPLFLLIQYAYTTDYQNQGRYLLPGVVPLMYYVVRGCEKASKLKRLPKWLPNAVVLLGTLGCVISTYLMVFKESLPLFLETSMFY